MARTTRETRRHATAAPVLPEELVVWEILVRVPAKTLLRCRAVCRSWCRRTSAADFLLAHHRRQLSLPLVTFHGSGRDFAVDAFDISGGSSAAAERRHPVLHFDDDRNPFFFKVSASCDGLLLVSFPSKNPHYICNPATRHWASIPQLKGCNVAAIYHHSTSGEYRILFWKGCLSKAHYVLTVGSSLEPRYIGSLSKAHYVLTVGSSLEPRYIGQFVASDRPPVLLHNCLHWLLNVGLMSRLLVFDTILESLKCMSPPPTHNSLVSRTCTGDRWYALHQLSQR